MPASRARAAPPAAADRRSLQVTLLLLAAGVLLAVIGAGRPWALLDATVQIPPLGQAPGGSVPLHGNDFAPFSGLALLALVLVVGVAVTRGRGRWLVGLALLALAGILLAQAVGVGGDARAEATARARRGEVVGVAPGGSLRVDTPRTGPVLVAAGALLLGAAGVEALRRGRRWPALGAAFRAPPDRQPPRPAADEEPPWEGD
jgi:uncharacterized membrane protein (TIGR02234 family)